MFKMYCSKEKRQVEFGVDLFVNGCLCADCDNVNCKRSNCMLCTYECLFSALLDKS